MVNWKIHDIIPSRVAERGKEKREGAKTAKGQKLGLISDGFQCAARRVPQMKGNSSACLRGSRFHPSPPPPRSRGDLVCV